MKIELDKEQLEHLYVDLKLSTVKIAEMFGYSARGIGLALKRFGIERRTFREATLMQHEHMTEEDIRKRAVAFRNTWYSRPKEERDRINKKKATKPENLKSAIEKARITKAKNNTGKKSKQEDEFYKSLLISFDEDDIIRQYSDERYPYLCDFYIKSQDKFIEFQGHPSHGIEPFNPLNEEHLKVLNESTLDMTTWTTRDPQKIQTAIENGICLVLIYPKHTNYIIQNGIMTSLQINELWKI